MASGCDGPPAAAPNLVAAAVGKRALSGHKGFAMLLSSCLGASLGSGLAGTGLMLGGMS